MKDAYIMAKNNSTLWMNYIKYWMTQAFHMLGLIQPVYVDPANFIANLEERLTEHFQQSWEGELQVITGKLRTYKVVKQDLKLEKYLDLPSHLKVPVTKLRTSSHSLRIETGR